MTGAVDTSQDRRTTADVVTVTIGDNATVFEGPDTVYRYDLPGSGVVEGWALAAVVDQIKQLTVAYWPEIEVVVDADEAATEMLTRTLLNKGVAAYASEALREVPLPQPEGEVEITRPTTGRTHRNLAVHPIHVAIVVVIVLVGGVSWWAIETTTAAPSEPTSPPAGEENSVKVAPDTPATDSEAATAPGPTEAEHPSAGEVVIEHSGLRVSVPFGFEPEMKDDALVLVGDDPHLRIHVAADPVHQVPAPAVHREIEAMVDSDDTLHLLTPASEGSNGKLVYREEPGDASVVTWTTWVTAGHQFSVGCHTRTAPTLPQQAACRMASESLSLGD